MGCGRHGKSELVGRHSALRRDAPASGSLSCRDCWRGNLIYQSDDDRRLSLTRREDEQHDRQPEEHEQRSNSPAGIRRRDLIGGANKASVLQTVTEDYLRRCGLDVKLDHGVDNLAMAMSLVASTRGLALMPAYAKNLLPWSVVSRPLEGEAPTIEVAVGFSKANTSPILKLFLSRLDELRTPMHEKIV
jgi:DNA-binding transcriptional LysR family regulator